MLINITDSDLALSNDELVRMIRTEIKNKCEGDKKDIENTKEVSINDLKRNIRDSMMIVDQKIRDKYSSKPSSTRYDYISELVDQLMEVLPSIKQEHIVLTATISDYMALTGKRI